VRLARSILAVVLVTASLGGCSLLTSSDGLSGEEAGGGEGGTSSHVPGVDAADDGAGPGEDADASVAQVDASLRDADVDAGAEAGGDRAAPDAAPLGFCASRAPAPLFCDDFDEATVLKGWDSTAMQRGQLAVAGTAARSLPGALKVTVDPLTSGLVDVAAYKKFASLAGKRMVATMAFDLYLDVVDTTHSADAVVAALDLLDPSGTLYELQIDAYLSGASVVVRFPEYSAPAGGGAEGYVAHDVTAPLALRTWTRVTIELTLTTPAGGTSNAARLLFDGVPVSATPINVIGSMGVPQMVMGVSYVRPPSDGWTVRYDNVSFDARLL
jgi:hypothetical protein